MTYADRLRRHQAVWAARPLVRSLYGDWFERVSAQLSSAAGETVELGAGISKFAESRPRVESTDLERTEWSERAVDAEALPFAPRSVANLVLIDVFHHLGSPGAFLDEAVRVLVPGGRVVMLEPYCSPISAVAYRLFHREPADLSALPFEDGGVNQARATLAFFRAGSGFAERWPSLAVASRRRLAVLAYPLSGGFEGKQLVPGRLIRPMLALDRALEPVLAPVCAFRCLVVLQRL